MTAPRRLRALAAVLAAAAGLAGASSLVGAPGLAAARASGPFDDSRRATGDLAFTGVVRLEWQDAAGRHQQRFLVRASHGNLLVRGPRDLLARDRERLVHRSGDDWSLLWPAELDPLRRPALEAKYRVSYATGVPIVGRPTRLVELRRDGRLWERLFVDQKSHLILRREHFAENGELVRTVTFEELRDGATELRGPARVDNHAPDTVPGMRVKRPFRAPAALGAGYRRVGTYRDGSMLQVLYSDGVYGLSIFEQRGALRRASVPHSARAVRVGARRAWTMSWAGGEIVMWQAGDAVFTAVGEGPLGDVLDAASALPDGGQPSLLERVRRAITRTLRGFSPD